MSGLILQKPLLFVIQINKLSYIIVVFTPKTETTLMNWRQLSYLKTGSAKQKAALKAVVETGVLEKQKKFDATLVSTINIGKEANDRFCVSIYF